MARLAWQNAPVDFIGIREDIRAALADGHPVVALESSVIAAGAKSILDLPRTLEALETLGVPVVGLGTRHFPAFYARSSGLVLDKHAERTLTPWQPVALRSRTGCVHTDW